ncbi:MAG: sulfatase [Chloroflexi bacterium]|nr:sulfatase [Chloroflexota bacterium]
MFNRLFRFDLAVVFMLLCLLFSSCRTPEHELGVVLPKENRPNILFIIVDDLDSKLNSIDYMKNLQDLMIARGTSLDDFLISNPLCCPSRTTVLRGQYTHNHQVYNNTAPDGSFSKFKEVGDGDSALGVWLQVAGYRTALMGKFLNGFPFPNDRLYIPPGWSEWVSPAKKNAYDGYDYVLNENGSLVVYPPDEVNYFTDVLSRKAKDFIQRAAVDKVPFFLYLAPFAPHAPATPAQRHLSLFPSVTIPVTPSFNEADVSDKSDNMSRNPLLSNEEIIKINKVYRQRILSMQAVDEMLAELIKTLKENGQLENTYIVFTSDNGYHLGQHRLLEGKGTLYEEDIVVPFIVRGPGIPEGRLISGLLAGNVDIAATITDWAGIIPPAFVDGRSLAGVLAGEPVNPIDWRQGYLLEVYPGNSPVDARINPAVTSANILQTILMFPFLPQRFLDPINIGIRTNQYLYMEHANGFVELYDLKNDPFELENIANQADPGLLEKLSTWVRDLSNCKADSCRKFDSRQLSQ